jgi:hypothetical protein
MTCPNVTLDNLDVSILNLMRKTHCDFHKKLTKYDWWPVRSEKKKGFVKIFTDVGDPSICFVILLTLVLGALWMLANRLP